MSDGITYSLGELGEDWLGPFEDAVFVTRLIEKRKKKSLLLGKTFRQFRAIAGIYGSNSIPALHLRFPSYKSFKENLTQNLGEKQDYRNCRVSTVCYISFHDWGCTVWFAHKTDENLNKANNWTLNEPASEKYISVEVEDNLTGSTQESE
tara:strand:+ start:15259 stop:15708 length:450 start_codon:yes stop_codon:yes gene_type:complete